MFADPQCWRTNKRIPRVIPTTTNNNNRFGGNGGYAGEADGLLVGVTKVVANAEAFLAMRSDGKIVAWGADWYGADTDGVWEHEYNKNVIDVFTNRYAMAALRSDGYMIKWFNADYGGDMAFPDLHNNATFVTAIAHTDGAFAAILDDTTALSFGHADYGGGASPAFLSSGGGGITSIVGSKRCFAALKNGFFHSWGGKQDNTTKCDTISAAAQAQNDGAAVSLFASDYAFAALSAGGRATVFGTPGRGGAPSDYVRSTLHANIQDFFYNDYAMIARRYNGSLVVWGDPKNGGDASSVEHMLTTGQVVDVASTQRAFAALFADKTLVSWGNATMYAYNVDKVVASESAFCALTNNSILVWGTGDTADTSAVDEFLAAGVADVFATPQAFLAVTLDGHIIVVSLIVSTNPPKHTHRRRATLTRPPSKHALLHKSGETRTVGPKRSWKPATRSPSTPTRTVLPRFSKVAGC